jgi:hypothetical protein
VFSLFGAPLQNFARGIASQGNNMAICTFYQRGTCRFGGNEQEYSTLYIPNVSQNNVKTSIQAVSAMEIVALAGVASVEAPTTTASAASIATVTAVIDTDQTNQINQTSQTSQINRAEPLVVSAQIQTKTSIYSWMIWTCFSQTQVADSL